MCVSYRKELKGIQSSLYIRGIVLSFKIVCRFSTFLSLATYVYSGNVFTAHQVFIVTSYFNHLYLTMLHLWPISLTFVGEAYVSIRRIQSFLLLPEGKYQRATNMSYNHDEYDDADDGGNDEAAEIQNLMGNGGINGDIVKTTNGKVVNGVGGNGSNGSYGTLNGQPTKTDIDNNRISNSSKKSKKNVLFRELQLSQKPFYKRRIVNSNAEKKGIIFDHVTAMWISDHNGQNIGE